MRCGYRPLILIVSKFVAGAKMRLKLIGISAVIAGVGLSIVPARAEQLTIAQYIDVLGDLQAISVICPDLDGNKGVVETFMQSNGMTEKLMEDQTGYWSDVEAATKASFARRKALSVEGNCADALGLYGENGTVIKGLLFRKAVAQTAN